MRVESSKDVMGAARTLNTLIKFIVKPIIKYGKRDQAVQTDVRKEKKTVAVATVQRIE